MRQLLKPGETAHTTYLCRPYAEIQKARRSLRDLRASWICNVLPPLDGGYAASTIYSPCCGFENTYALYRLSGVTGPFAVKMRSQDFGSISCAHSYFSYGGYLLPIAIAQQMRLYKKSFRVQWQRCRILQYCGRLNVHTKRFFALVPDLFMYLLNRLFFSI